MQRIVAVTVTYNSHDLLKRCVESLLKQMHKLEKIIIIDNCSKSEISNLNKTLESDAVTVIRLDTNTGGAGGFEYGMNESLKYNPDWVWLMDDDAFPEPDCLSKLLDYEDYQNVGCICPAIYGVNLNKYQIYHHKYINKHFIESKVYEDFDQFADCFEVDANAFVGPLVKREVIDDIGVANGKLFIYGDDTEYTFRISRKYKVIVIKNAKINHRDVVVNNPKNDCKALWKEYYNYRNRFLLVRKYSNSWMNKKISFLKIKLLILKRIIGTMVKKKYKGYRKIRIKVFLKAIKDGKKGIEGKIIDPVEFNKKNGFI